MNLAAEALTCRTRGTVHSWPELLDLGGCFEGEVSNCAKRGSCHASLCHSENKNFIVTVYFSNCISVKVKVRHVKIENRQFPTPIIFWYHFIITINLSIVSCVSTHR